MTDKIRILIVDDDPQFRELLKLVLRRIDDFEVVGEAADGRSAVARFNHLTGMWTKAMSVPNVNDGGQAQVHFSMVPDPFDPDVVYLAGDSHEVGPRGDVRRFDTVDGTSQSLVQAGAKAATSPRDVADRLAELLFQETTTIGVRWSEVRRRRLPWELVRLPTTLGPVTFKVSTLGGRVVTVTPEFEEVRRIADREGRPVREVLETPRDPDKLRADVLAMRAEIAAGLTPPQRERYQQLMAEHDRRRRRAEQSLTGRGHPRPAHQPDMALGRWRSGGRPLFRTGGPGSPALAGHDI